MKEDQEQKCHVCRFCKQGFSNGKKLGGHMRRHLALIAACRTQNIINGQKGVHVYSGKKQSIQENDQENNNGSKSIDFDDKLVNKSQQEHDSRTNVCVLKDYDASRTELMKDSVCKKCGKVFESMKALYGHMRCHSIKRSRPLDGSSDGVANLVSNKRSCTRYKSVKHDLFTSLSSVGDEVEEGAICLMMLSKGVKGLEGGKMVNSSQDGFEVLMQCCKSKNKLKNKCKVGLEKDLVFESGSGQMDPGRSRSTIAKWKSTKK